MVSLVHLDGGAGLSVEVITLGASTRRVRFADRDLCLYLDDVASYEDDSLNPFLGATVGRFANRIAGARFELDGTIHNLSANDGPNTLHGGGDGFSRRIWTLDETGTTDGDMAAAWAGLSLVSPDGDQGFPGRVEARVTYRVSGSTLGVEFEATTDAPTPVSLTNHAYWNLEGPQSTSVADHRVRLAASTYLPVDSAALPTGDVARVDRTRFDFTTARPVNAVDDTGYDHCFVIDESDGNSGLTHAATVHAGGITMTVATDRPGLQLYTGTFLDGKVGGGGRAHQRSGGLCLETQAFPDAPNQPHFPAATLRPGQTHQTQTQFHFTQPGPSGV